MYETNRIFSSVWSYSRRLFGLDIRFIDDFKTRLVNTLNYSVIANFPVLQNTRKPVKFFLACSVFTSICLVTALTMATPLLPY
jgi:hypothetical protein